MNRQLKALDVLFSWRLSSISSFRWFEKPLATKCFRTWLQSINKQSMNLRVCGGTWRQRLCCDRFDQSQGHLHFDVNNFGQSNPLESQIFFSGKVLNTIVISCCDGSLHISFWKSMNAYYLRSKRLLSYSATNCGNIYHQSCASPLRQSVLFHLYLCSHSASAVVPFLQRVTRYFRIVFLHTWHWESHLMHP